jgi:hypothetical protein
LLIVLAQAVHAVRLGQHLPAQAPIRASRTNLAAGRILGADAKLPQSNANANEKFPMKIQLGASYFPENWAQISRPPQSGTHKKRKNKNLGRKETKSAKIQNVFVAFVPF